MTGNQAQEIKIDEKREYPLKQIYFYLTEGCNLACRHCWLDPKHQNKNIIYPSLSIAVIQSVIEQAKPLGLTSVKLTGGEPLMHPQIDIILNLLMEENISCGIETNGVLCTPELAQKIASFKRCHISVSLDGADAATHEWVRGVKGCFEAAVNGIKNFANVGLKPQIIMTIMEANKNQLPALVCLGESLGAESIKFNPVQPTGRGETISEKGQTLPLEEILELGEMVNNKLSHSTKLKLHFDHPSAFRSMSRMFGEHGTGCASCKILEIIGVLSNGNYALCGIGTHIDRLVFGNVEKKRLADIWLNNEILVELRQGIPGRFEGICGRCHMKKVCSAKCIAQNYYRSRSLWQPYWLCDEAQKKGLFPQTRMI